MNKPVVNTIVSGPKYAPSTYQTVVLKSSQDFKAVVESEPNKKYIVKYDFDLGGETVTVPDGCLIEMDGGTISNGTMVGDHTILIYFQDFEDCIQDITMQGTWKYNNPRDGIMTENIYDENLDETQKQFNARVQAALTEANRRAQAVIPLPDEEDLTTDGDHNIKLKNKAYAPAQFSGLGKIYLRKNIVEIALPFNGFVEDVTLESEGLTSAPAAIFFDSTNGIFVGIDNLLEPKYYGTWLNGSAYNTEGTLADDDEFKNTTDNKYYKYDDGALTLISTPTTKNILTQEMFSQANTVYIIQYDYDLNGVGSNDTDPITIPEGCTLQFEGGVIKNGTLVGNNTKIEAGLIQIFSTDITLDGSWDVQYTIPEWFGAKTDGSDCSDAIAAAIRNIAALSCTIFFNRGNYGISRPIDLTHNNCVELCGVSYYTHTRRTIPCSTLVALSTMSHMVKIVDDYEYGDVTSINGKGVCIKNLLLKGENKADVGVNVRSYDVVENCTAIECVHNGFVIEAATYPAHIRRCRAQACGENGLYIQAPYTTIYTIEDFEAYYNNGYGMYIEAGSACIISNIVLEGNHRGGCRIIDPDVQWAEGRRNFLSRITFISLYTEANGDLASDNPNYDGNYGLKITGKNEDGTSAAGKIEGLVFVGGAINASTDGGTSYIRGTSGLYYFGTLGMSISLDYNIWPGNTTSSGIQFQAGKPLLKKYNIVSAHDNRLQLFSYVENAQKRLSSAQDSNCICVGALVKINVRFPINSNAIDAEGESGVFLNLGQNIPGSVYNYEEVLGFGIVGTRMCEVHYRKQSTEGFRTYLVFIDTGVTVKEKDLVGVSTVYLNLSYTDPNFTYA